MRAGAGRFRRARARPAAAAACARLGGSGPGASRGGGVRSADAVGSCGRRAETVEAGIADDERWVPAGWPLGAVARGSLHRMQVSAASSSLMAPDRSFPFSGCNRATACAPSEAPPLHRVKRRGLPRRSRRRTGSDMCIGCNATRRCCIRCNSWSGGVLLGPSLLHWMQPSWSWLRGRAGPHPSATPALHWMQTGRGRGSTSEPQRRLGQLPVHWPGASAAPTAQPAWVAPSRRGSARQQSGASGILSR